MAMSNAIADELDILDSFNIVEVSRIVHDQINGSGDSDNFTDTMVDHFKPVYKNYMRLLNMNDEEDVKGDAQSRYIDICKVFLQEIFTKFNISVDDNWIDDNYETLPAITLGFYSFFILDLHANLTEASITYIIKNSKEIVNTFESLQTKKDAVTLSNKKKLSPEMAIIVSNMYDIVTWIIDQFDENTFFEYLSKDYISGNLISGLYNTGVLGGTFMNNIKDIFRLSIMMQSTISFNIIYKIKVGEIKDLFAEE